jgi:glycogen synthase
MAAADFQLIDIATPAGGHSSLCGVPFGAIPIGPRAFELADCMVDYDASSDTGTGFLYAPEELEHCQSVLRAALATDNRASLMRRVTELDVSWATAAVRYVDVLAGKSRTAENWIR